MPDPSAPTVDLRDADRRQQIDLTQLDQRGPGDGERIDQVAQRTTVRADEPPVVRDPSYYLG